MLIAAMLTAGAAEAVERPTALVDLDQVERKWESYRALLRRSKQTPTPGRDDRDVFGQVLAQPRFNEFSKYQARMSFCIAAADSVFASFRRLHDLRDLLAVNERVGDGNGAYRWDYVLEQRTNLQQGIATATSNHSETARDWLATVGRCDATAAEFGQWLDKADQERERVTEQELWCD